MPRHKQIFSSFIKKVRGWTPYTNTLVRARNHAVAARSKVTKLKAQLHSSTKKGAWDKIMTKLTEARGIATKARTEAIAVSHPEEAAETLDILGNAEHVLPEVFGRWGPIEMAKVKMPVIEFLKGIAIGAKDSFFSKFPTTLPEIGSLIVRTVIPGGNQIVAGLEIAYEGVQSAKAKMDQAIEKVDTVQKELVAKGQEKVQRLSEKLGVDKLNTCLLYTSPSPRDRTRSRMPSSA